MRFRRPLSKISTTVFASLLFLLIVGLFLAPGLFEQASGIYKKYISIYSSMDSFKEFTLGFGMWAPVAFFFAHVLQIVIAPIPGNIVAMVGGALFGVVKGLLLSGSGQIVGSIIAFYLARGFRKPLVLRLIGKGTYYKYKKLFSGRFLLGLFLVFLLPFFPDDALCFLAGLSTIPFLLFLILVVAGRLPGIFVATLVGAEVIELSVYQWFLLAFFSLVLIYFVVKYRQQLEEWISVKFGMGYILNAASEDQNSKKID